ncbi:MAG TPA: chemotaxis protein CheW [Chroococcales cyanobacterium]|jgi:purine-binding chemotaxis protein CheW
MQALRSETQELVILSIGELSCAIDIVHIQEINKHLDITTVHGASKTVRGVLNLRGQIVTVLDLRVKFGLESACIGEEMRIVIVRAGNENIGLLVDAVDDVVVAAKPDMEPPPSNVGGISGAYFTAIYKTENGLVALLDIEEILKKEQAS